MTAERVVRGTSSAAASAPVRVHAVLRLLMAALITFTVVVQLAEALTRAIPASAGNFFSYFTIQSNIIVAMVFAVAAGIQLRRQEEPRWLDRVRGAATVYISITGVVYALLLSNIDVNTPLPWANVVLHYVVPIVTVVDWLLDLPERTIPLRSALIWLAYPLAYLIYSLIRGPIVDWYPYPFLNPEPHGYGYVAVMSVCVAIVAAVFVALVAGATRLPGRMLR
jgi:hypothetical protein